VNVKRPNLGSRQLLLLGAASVAVLTLPILRYAVLPSYDNWRNLVARVSAQEEEYADLQMNIRLKEDIAGQFEQANARPEPFQSNEVTLSKFFKAVEGIAGKQRSLKLVNMKPRSVDVRKTHRLYHVKLVIAGRLPEVISFVTELMRGPVIAGIESFSLRGIQGADMVECVLSVSMLRLLPYSDAIGPKPQSGAPPGR